MGAGTHPQEWHDRRSRGIGSSDIAALLGLSAWATPYSVWCEKLGHDTPGTERMRWGTLLENVIMDEAARRLGVTITGRQVEAQHPVHEWAIATLDATYAEPPAATDAGVLEAKATSESRWDAVPPHYEAQVQWQLEVRNLPAAWVACLHGGNRLTLWLVERDEQTGAGLLRVAARFWEQHVLAGIPPEVDAAPATADALTRRYAATVPELTADLGPLRNEIARIREIRHMVHDMETESAELENMVRAALGAAEAGVIDGEEAVTWRPHTRRRVDTGRLRDEQPQLAEKYTASTTVRPLRVKGES